MESDARCYICLENVEPHDRSDCLCKGTLGRRHLACAVKMVTVAEGKCPVCRDWDMAHPSNQVMSSVSRARRGALTMEIVCMTALWVTMTMLANTAAAWYGSTDNSRWWMQGINGFVYSHVSSKIPIHSRSVVAMLITAQIGLFMVTYPEIHKLSAVAMSLLAYAGMGVMVFSVDVMYWVTVKLKRMYRQL